MFHKDLSKSVASLSDVRQKNNAERMARILTSQQLLLSEKRQSQIKDYITLSGLDEQQFDIFCQSLINSLAIYLQDLPATRNSYFSGKAGFFNHILNRCQASLHACRAYFINDKGKVETSLSSEQQLWMYCLFSASLLRGIGNLVVDFNIDIFNLTGNLIGRFDPMTGSMHDHGAAFYDYDFDKPSQDTFKRRVTLALATKLMPTKGLAWLSEQKDVFEIWLALLDEDLRAAGTLGIIIDKANWLVINKFFREKAAQDYNKDIVPAKRAERQFNLTEKELDNYDFDEIPPAGIEFIKWLTKALGTARLMVNQAPLLSVPGGLLMSPDMFKLFIREHPEFKNWQNVQNAVAQMNMHSLGLDGDKIQQFKNDKTKTMHSGMVLSSVGVVLPETFKMVQANGTIKNVASHDFSAVTKASNHMTVQKSAAPPIQAISRAGKWVTPTSNLIPKPTTGQG